MAMTALRQEALNLVERCPEENLDMLMDFLRPVCTAMMANENDDDSNPLEFLSGLLAGTPYITDKELREERLKEKYADYL